MASISTTTVTVLSSGTTNTHTKVEISRHRHDCDECHFMGLHDVGEREYDLYFCPTSRDLIARYGYDGDYKSCNSNYLSFADIVKDEPLAVLVTKLQALGLL